jgi:hypothetical protein
MLSKKTLLSIAAFSAAVAPLITNIDFDFKLEVSSKDKVEKPYTVVETSCNLISKKTSDKLLVCEYQCASGDKGPIQKTYYNRSGSCPSSTTERVRLTKRN